ncbi:MAG: AN1-type zinc finger domain-containing protein [Promethearchaeota archaeon]
MKLNSKYMIGFSVIIALSLGFFLSSLIINISPSLRLLTLGIVTTITGMIFIVLLFAPERIKGYQAEYEASPDLTNFKVVKVYADKVQERPEIPEVAFCSACGKRIFKPFYCAKCGQILCGTHYLPGSHTCKEEL